MNGVDQAGPRLAEAFGELSVALEHVPAGRVELFLAKLLLMLSRELPTETLQEGVRIALQDLDYSPTGESTQG